MPGGALGSANMSRMLADEPADIPLIPHLIDLL
jgi:hypothetical protein